MHIRFDEKQCPTSLIDKKYQRVPKRNKKRKNMLRAPAKSVVSDVIMCDSAPVRRQVFFGTRHSSVLILLSITIEILLKSTTAGPAWHKRGDEENRLCVIYRLLGAGRSSSRVLPEIRIYSARVRFIGSSVHPRVCLVNGDGRRRSSATMGAICAKLLGAPDLCWLK